jgi:Mechanosensitive ion channel
MTLKQKVMLAVLAALLAVSGTLWIRTAPPTAKTVRRHAAELAAAELVDRTTYTSAERLAAQATSAEEQPLAASALRVADHALDLAFTTALSEVEAHPPALNSDAAKIEDRIHKSQVLFDADQQRVTAATGALSQAKAAQKDALQDELDLAQSQLELDKDELDEANQDLVDAGGNPRQQIEAQIQEHNAQTKAQAARAPVAPLTGQFENGSLGKFRQWLKVRAKRQELAEAQAATAQKADELLKRRIALAESLETTKGSISALAQHTKSAKAGEAVPRPTPAGPVQRSHDDAAALLNQTKLITADQKVLTLLDRRIADQRQLNGIYGNWLNLVDLQAQVLAHALLLNALIVLLVLLAIVLLERWLQHLLDNPKLDRRQVETLRSITRVALRVLAVVVILLIAIGMPSQFGTMIGIVGAGLTVALKDFIVAFFGWLVLMGRNGIRLGDWVEINGVSGEVTELGIFHTVLLETGNWSDSGHPTGRRVTFTNSFAIEGHYFNFSTSGQWLWDELQIVVPAGQDPYPIVEAITHQVSEATAESARLAEQEWQRAVPASRGKVFSGTPGVNVKPVVGGVEISVRYITRANERFLQRAKLYQGAVDLLGQKQPAHS